MARIRLTLEGYKIVDAGTKPSEKGNYMNLGVTPPDRHGVQSALVIFSKSPLKLGDTPKLVGSTFELEQTCFMEGEK